jgi:hypothetical protein
MDLVAKKKRDLLGILDTGVAVKVTCGKCAAGRSGVLAAVVVVLAFALSHGDVMR